MAPFGFTLPVGGASAFLLSWNWYWEGMLSPRFPALTNVSSS